MFDGNISHFDTSARWRATREPSNSQAAQRIASPDLLGCCWLHSNRYGHISFTRLHPCIVWCHLFPSLQTSPCDLAKSWHLASLTSWMPWTSSLDLRFQVYPKPSSTGFTPRCSKSRTDTLCSCCRGWGRNHIGVWPWLVSEQIDLAAKHLHNAHSHNPCSPNVLTFGVFLSCRTTGQTWQFSFGLIRSWTQLAPWDNLTSASSETRRCYLMDACRTFVDANEWTSCGQTLPWFLVWGFYLSVIGLYKGMAAICSAEQSFCQLPQATSYQGLWFAKQHRPSVHNRLEPRSRQVDRRFPIPTPQTASLRFRRRSVATESAMPPLMVSSQTRGERLENHVGGNGSVS